MSLETFLTMVAQWIVGHRTLYRVENGEEKHLLRQAVADRLWILDREGGASDAWTYSLYNDCRCETTTDVGRHDRGQCADTPRAGLRKLRQAKRSPVMTSDPQPEHLAEPAAVDRVVAWSSDERPGSKCLAVVGDSRPKRVEVLRAVHRRVPGSLLIDAVGKTADELLLEVMDLVGVPESRRRPLHWRAALKRRGKGRLVVVTGVQRASLTRRSAQPVMVLERFVQSLAIADLRVVTETEPHVSQRRAIRVHLANGPDSGRADWSDEELRLLRVLALSEPRRVPLPVWRQLAEGAGVELLGDKELVAFARRFPALLAVEADEIPVVCFRDEDVAERLRGEADPDLVRRVNAHMVEWLRDAVSELHHPDGWAASGPVGGYAAAGLAMHAVQAGMFEEILQDGEIVANVRRAALLDAARCEFGEGMPGGNPAADANYLAMYGVNPSTQAEWAAWLHLMAVARGDTELASAIAGARDDRGSPVEGIRLPWRAKWTRWRPPGGLHRAYLDPGPVNDLIEVRWEGRPAVVTVGDRDGAVRVWDLDTGDLLAGPWTGEAIPAGPRAAMTWPDPDRRGQAGPATLRDLEAASGWEDGPLWGWLTARQETDRTIVLAGEGGVLALEPADAENFAGVEPCRPELLADAHSAPGTVQPAGAGAPSPADLVALLGAGVVRRVPVAALPSGLTDEASRRMLVQFGLPRLDEQGLGLQPHHAAFLSEVHWPSHWSAPEETGPFFRLGQWMGGLVVLDGPTGRVLRVPAGPDEPGLEGSLVASGLEKFLTMVAWWLTGHRVLDVVENELESHVLRQDIEGELWVLDPEGSESDAWTYSLCNDRP